MYIRSDPFCSGLRYVNDIVHRTFPVFVDSIASLRFELISFTIVNLGIVC